MAFLHKQTITKIEIWPVFIPTTTPFVVATGRLDQTHNLFIRITLHSGTWGIGEIAPFPDITGEISILVIVCLCRKAIDNVYVEEKPKG